MVAMASLNSIATQPFLPLGSNLPSKAKPTSSFFYQPKLSSPHRPTFKFLQNQIVPKQRGIVAGAVSEELEVIPVGRGDTTDFENGFVLTRVDSDREGEAEKQQQVVGFHDDGRLSIEGTAGGCSSSSFSGVGGGGGDAGADNEEKLVDRAINATIVLAAGSFAVTKLLTIDHDYWHGWTIFEILRYAPQHNWSAYEEALKANPVLAKMMISGIVYSVGDWIAQCCEGKPLFEFDRGRMLKSGLVGFSLHGSLSHYYYQFCEALFPFQDWWVVPAKVVFDQTLWAATWNSIYYIMLGFLRLESPASIFGELKATFWPMLTAGWKLWPFAHLITYGVIPVEQRLLWVDCVELIWVTILSTYSNEKSKARISDAAAAEAHSGAIDPKE